MHQIRDSAPIQAEFIQRGHETLALNGARISAHRYIVL
jgi:hypothetical protein